MRTINPKVTVLMSVYNGKKYLREAIDSILNQTFKDFEFLIIDDGSTDSSAEIIRSYTDPRWIGFEDLLEGNKIFHGSVLFKRKNILDIGGYDERLPKAQDYDLWLRVSGKVEIIKLKRILFLRRLHFDCVSMKGILKQEYYADMVKRKNEFACRSSNKSQSLLQKYRYRKRAMLRLRGYANLFLQDNCVKQGIYLLLKSFCLYPTRSGLKQLVLVLLTDVFKLKKLRQSLVR